jgi:hypothetical protein
MCRQNLASWISMRKSRVPWWVVVPLWFVWAMAWVASWSCGWVVARVQRYRSVERRGVQTMEQTWAYMVLRGMLWLPTRISLAAATWADACPVCWWRQPCPYHWRALHGIAEVEKKKRRKSHGG